MTNAYTYTKGDETRTFSSRKELYDYMIERGEVVLEGDDAPIFANHVSKSAHPKARDCAAKIADLSTHTQANEIASRVK